MKANYGPTPVPLPDPVNSPAKIGKFSRQVRQAIAALRDRRVIVHGKTSGRSGNTLPPFHVVLSTVSADPPTYYVTVTDGRVTDRVPGDNGDAVISYEAGNIRYTANNPSATPPEVIGDPRRFEIAVGETVCVRVEVLATGAIGKESVGEEEYVKIEVGEGTAIESIHYIPPVADDDEGTPGTYFYQLAKLEAGAEPGDPPTLVRIMDGSHIDHYRERPMIDNAGAGDGKIVKDYDAPTDTYRMRSLSGEYGIEITQNTDDIDIAVDAENIGGGEEVLKLPVPTPPDTYPPYPDEPLKFKTIRELYSGEVTGITAQVRVETADGELSDAGAADTIRVRGNGKKGSITFKDCDGNTIVTLSWEDGLITTADGDYEIEAGCDGGGSAS